MVLMAELVLIRFEYRYALKADDVHLYIEYTDANVIEEIVRIIRDKHLSMKELEITRVAGDNEAMKYCAIIAVSVSRKQLDEEVVKSINLVENVTTVEEL